MLDPGTYVVCATLPTGWAATDPTSEVTGYIGQPCKRVTLAPGKVATVRFGQYESMQVAMVEGPLDDPTIEADSNTDLAPATLDETLDDAVDEAVDETMDELAERNEENPLTQRFFLPIIIR